MKWEYKTVDVLLSDTMLNVIGQDGWELVSYISDRDKYGTLDHLYTFKREKTHE